MSKYTLLLYVLLFFHKINAQTKPNIIFILTDDLGYSDLGCYGNPFNETKYIDSLAKGGLRFTQAYAASTVCSPSRAAIMTGKHPARLKLTNYLVGERKDSLSPVNPPNWQRFLPNAEITMAERLNDLGYQTGMVGKWHLGWGKEQMPWVQGFDYNRMIDKNGLDYYNYSIISNGGKTVFQDKGTDYLTDKLSDYALEFIEKRQKEQPFFLYLCYSAPHVLLVPRADKLGKYFWKTEKFGEKYNTNYAAMIESVDDGVGRILKTLTEQGLLENTLIVFTSDNGHVGLPELGPTPAHSDILRKWKGHVYEGGIRIPAIWFWKGKIQPSVTPQYFCHTDYVPTFLDILGQKTDISPDGKSIWQVTQNPEKALDRGALYWHYPHFSNQGGKPYGAIRLGDWKLVESYETNKVELYNLANDLAEKVDLSKKNKAKTKELYDSLILWRKEVEANMPIRKKG